MEAKINIEKVRKGDHVAFKAFFECFYPKLMALACRFVDEQVARFGASFTSYWERKRLFNRIISNLSFLSGCKIVA